MNKKGYTKRQTCYCGKGHYKYGSALYDYYSCGHAFEKPLNDHESGRWIRFNPYKKTVSE